MTLLADHAAYPDVNFVFSRGQAPPEAEHPHIWSGYANSARTGRSLAVSYGHRTIEDAARAIEAQLTDAGYRAFP